MVDVYARYCEFEGCKKCPKFNLEGLNSARFCIVHKHDQMVSMFNPKTCESPDCDKTANFSFAGSKPPRFCKVHKDDGMVDVKTKRCVHDACKRFQGYNFPGLPKRYCGTHKLSGMVLNGSKNAGKQPSTGVDVDVGADAGADAGVHAGTSSGPSPITGRERLRGGGKGGAPAGTCM
jgi:hypothetical protein